MGYFGFNEKTVRAEWWYGLIGGLIAMPLTIGQYLIQESGTFSLALVIVGGLVAGYLSARNERNAKRAGAIAGVVGAIPGLLLFLPALLELFGGWIAAGSIILSIVAFAITLTVILGGASLAGFIGGAIGGWLANARRRGNSLTST